MPFRKSKPWGQTKPPVGYGLDGSWRFRSYVAGYWLFNEGAGIPRDMLSGVSASITKISWAPGASSGPATNINEADGTGVVNTNRLSGINWSTGSVAWRVYLTQAYNDATDRFHWGFNGGAVPEFSCRKYTDNKWYAGWNNATADRRVIFSASATNWPQNKWSTYVFTWGASGSFLYLNGLQIGTNATAPVTTAVNQNLGILNTIGTNGSLGTGSKMDWLFILNGYAMKAVDAFDLMANPFQGIVTPRRRIISSSGVAPTFQAAWATRRNRVIGAGVI